MPGLIRGTGRALLNQRPPPILSYRGSTHDSTNRNANTAYTFAGFDIGAAAQDRVVVVAIGNRWQGAIGGGGSSASATVAIDGVDAPLVIRQDRDNTIGTALHSLVVPNGNSASIAVTYITQTSSNCCIGVWALYGLRSAKPIASIASNADPSVLSQNMLTGGIVIGAATTQSGSFAPNANWTENFDFAASDGQASFTGLSYQALTNESPRTLTTDPSGSFPVGVSAVWR